MHEGRRLAVWLELDSGARITGEIEELEDEGVGDTVARVIDKVTGGRLKPSDDDDCGCKKRQRALNEMFPYTQEVNDGD
jgi:hypothetical protein